METIQPRSASVVEPIGAAIEKTKQILFQPFDIGKWFTLGFCAWLATLGENGGGGNFGNLGNFGNHSNGHPSPDFQQEFQNIKQGVLDNLPVVLTVSIVVIAIILALAFLFMWLKSRGHFMFLHGVANNVGEVVVPWHRYARRANSLFLFRVVLWLLGSFVSLLLIVPLGFIFMIFAKNDFKVFAATAVIPAVFLVLGFIILGIVFAVIRVLTKDFVVPIMYLHDCTVTEGWKRFWVLCKPNMGTFVLFLLFLIVVSVGLGVIGMAVVMAACCLCCVGIIFMLPYIGTVAMLPLFVWRRAYSALFLAQFGPEFDVFANVTPVVVPSASIRPVPPVIEGGDLPPQGPEQNF